MCFRLNEQELWFVERSFFGRVIAWLCKQARQKRVLFPDITSFSQRFSVRSWRFKEPPLGTGAVVVDG